MARPNRPEPGTKITIREDYLVKRTSLDPAKYRDHVGYVDHYLKSSGRALVIFTNFHGRHRDSLVLVDPRYLTVVPDGS